MTSYAATHAPSALILAAGRGERMRPLTDACPKPLLRVRGQALLSWHVQALLRSGVRCIVVNTAWLGQSIREHFEAYRVSDGSYCLPVGEAPDAVRVSCTLLFSDEEADFGRALETAGGISRALPLLCPPNSTGDFWVVAGDVFVPDWVFHWDAVARFRATDALAHLWLVPNPPHHPNGDFDIDAQGRAVDGPSTSTPLCHTYSTIGLYRHSLFAPPWCDTAVGNPKGETAALAPLLRRAMRQGRISAELYAGAWTDVGTPQRLAQLNAERS